MKISVIGKDTLAAAVTECCADHFDVMTQENGEADVVWICHDTPINEKGIPDSEWVMDEIGNTMRRLKNMVTPTRRPLMLVSSQMPVGTTDRLERDFPEYHWAYSPENLRVATAVADFKNQPRVVVGTRHPESRLTYEHIFKHFTPHIIFTDPETAEMVKHALNTFLGLQIAFINEVARIAKVTGADMNVVTTALRLDNRVSPKAPLISGPPFGGGHLARDIYTLDFIAQSANLKCPIIGHIIESNEG